MCAPIIYKMILVLKSILEQVFSCLLLPFSFLFYVFLEAVFAISDPSCTAIIFLVTSSRALLLINFLWLVV